MASLAGLGRGRGRSRCATSSSRPCCRSGTSALVGRTALVVEEVTAHAGQVHIGGELWSSRPYDETLTIPVGSTVDVMLIEGATALVYPRE